MVKKSVTIREGINLKKMVSQKKDSRHATQEEKRVDDSFCEAVWPGKYSI